MFLTQKVLSSWDWTCLIFTSEFWTYPNFSLWEFSNHQLKLKSSIIKFELLSIYLHINVKYWYIKKIKDTLEHTWKSRKDFNITTISMIISLIFKGQIGRERSIFFLMEHNQNQMTNPFSTLECEIYLQNSKIIVWIKSNHFCVYDYENKRSIDYSW